jgi:hypothetical protein
VTTYPEIVTDHYGLLEMVVCDWFFDLDQFMFDKVAQEAFLYLGGGRHGAYDDVRLRVTDVLAVSVNDTAQVRIYILENIRFEDALVRFEASPYIDIDLRVGTKCRLEVMHKAKGDGLWGRYDPAPPRQPPIIIPTPADLVGRLLHAIRRKNRS